MDVITVPSPDCYACEPGEDWEAHSRRLFAPMEETLARHADEICAVIVEPLVQCAGSMRMYHPAYLALLREACDRHGVHLIADEIAVGFGRTGTMFACEQETVSPDFLCLAKGLTAGYLPMAATLTTERVWNAFLGTHADRRTFFHGHTYGGNPLAAAVGLESLDVFRDDAVLDSLPPKIERLRAHAARIAGLDHVGAVRQCGLVVGFDLVADKATGRGYPWQERRGMQACLAARTHGALLRPLGDTVVIMPPLSITLDELDLLAAAAEAGIRDATAP
jgi:adenosylmethionine-8-amino-7-oxononanoate aminotransferase